MGFTLDDDNLDVSVPDRKVKVPKPENMANADFDFQEGFTNLMKQGGTKARKPIKFKHKPLQRGAKIIQSSTDGDRRRSKNKIFGFKSTPIKDGARVIRKIGKRR